MYKIYIAYQFKGSVYDWKTEERLEKFMDFAALSVEGAIAHICEDVGGKETNRHDFQSYGYVNVEIETPHGSTFVGEPPPDIKTVYCIFPIKVISE